MNTNGFVLVLRLDLDFYRAMKLLRVTVICCSCFCMVLLACLFCFAEAMTELRTSCILGCSYHLMMQKCAYFFACLIYSVLVVVRRKRAFIPQVDKNNICEKIVFVSIVGAKNRGVQTILSEVM